MPIYSHSKLNTFENCPLKYKLHYIDRITSEEEGIEAFMGSRVHSALEKLYRDKGKAKDNTLEELLTFYSNEWEKEWHDQVVINRKDCTKENYIDIGKKAIMRYYERFRPFEQGITVWTEESVHFEVCGYKMAGVVDRLDRMKDGNYEIHDYKTSGRLPEQKDMDEDRQLALYEIALRNKWNDVGEVRLVWHYLVFEQEIVSKRTKQQLKTLEKEICDLIDKIEATREFKPSSSRLCDWCEYWEYCPEKKHLVKISEMKPADAKKEDGFKLVNEYAKLKAQEKDIQTKLEDYKERIISYAITEKVSKVQGSDVVASVSTTVTTSFPSKSSDEEKYDELVEIVKNAKVWDEFSTLDLRALAKELDSDKLDAKLKKKLKEYIDAKTITSVRLTKVKDEED